MNGTDLPLPYRCLLFVPATRPERFAKALASGPDAIILDLEDAVPAADKDLARQHAAAWFASGQRGLLRINGVESPCFGDDALCARAGHVTGVMLPKAESAGQVQALASLLGPDIEIFPLIESAQGMWRAMEIASAPNVRQLVFGTLDFLLDTGIEADGRELDGFRSQLSVISRVAGIDAPLDGVCTAIDDLAQLRHDTLAAKRLGMAGKLCIHPKQVGVVKECYRPSAQELAWARRIVAAANQAQGAAVALDGKMVDRPVILRALRTVRLYEQADGGSPRARDVGTAS